MLPAPWYALVPVVPILPLCYPFPPYADYPYFCLVQIKTRKLIHSLPHALQAVFFYVRSDTNFKTDFARNVQELVLTAPTNSSTLHYPLSICIEGDSSYRLQRTGIDELKYVRMSNHEIDDLKATLRVRVDFVGT